MGKQQSLLMRQIGRSPLPRLEYSICCRNQCAKIALHEGLVFLGLDFWTEEKLAAGLEGSIVSHAGKLIGSFSTLMKDKCFAWCQICALDQSNMSQSPYYCHLLKVGVRRVHCSHHCLKTVLVALQSKVETVVKELCAPTLRGTVFEKNMWQTYGSLN